MLEAMLAGLIQTLSWQSLALMLLAVPIGMFLGAAPGIGGKVGLALMIPFVIGMDPVPGFALLLGMHAVVHTGGCIPCILFGTPGGGADAATVVDGYPMAKKGEAGRAMGAALMASGIGGIIGALFMAVMIPVVRPVVLAFGPSEFFMLAILGIALISTISGKSLLRGLIAGAFGLILSFVGMDPQTGIVRYGFDMIFMWDGLDLAAIVVGLFGIAEMIELGVFGGSIAREKSTVSGYTFAGVIQGMKDTIREKWLLFRCSLIGAFIGLIPGLGGDAASWICYGHAVQSSKDPETFGKGNVRGVIAPESANNSKEGGALIPTIAFGIPGSSGMALLLGAFIVLGIVPGPTMLVDELDTVWALVWILVITNIMGVVMLLLATGWIAKLSFVRVSLIIPIMLVFIFLGGYLGRNLWQNLVIAVIFGLIGYAMKKFDYSRPALIIGLVLGPMAESNLHKSMDLWGLAFLGRPITIVLLALTLLTILYPIYKKRRAKGAESK